MVAIGGEKAELVQGDFAPEKPENGGGWLDDFWSVVLACPMVLAFMPGAQDFVSRGFQIISQDAPGWYLTAVAGAVAWAFGRRAAPSVLGLAKR